MRLFSKLLISRRALSTPRLFRRTLSSKRLSETETLPEDYSSFLQDVKEIDPKVLATAMGGGDKPPEEPLFSTFEEGFGYFTFAAVGRSLRHYTFVRKLGWAASSSVWLALDTSKETRTYVAIKILTSQATARVVVDRSPEFAVYQKIGSANPNNPGFNHCLTIQQCIIAKSAAGSHICFVTDPLSSSLANLRPHGENRFTLPIAKRITKQVLLALDYLHRECGYIHTDVKCDNILVSAPQPASSRIMEYIRANPASIYGPPLHLKSISLPIVFARSEPLPYFSLGGSIEDISVRLVDYSEAVPVDKVDPEYFCQPAVIRAPEVTLRYPWTSTIDIWTVGCLLFQLLTECGLFDQDSDNYSHDLHLQYIVECLGQFPPEFLKECKDRDKYFDEKGMLLRTNGDFTPSALEDVLRTLNAVDESEVTGTAGFLRKCLMLDPKLRPSAQELLQDNWLQ